MKIVIISPTYNEVVNIQKLIPVLEEEILPKVKHHDMHILIIDDNSPDGTAEEVKKFMHKWKNIELLQGKKQGLGAAYVRGMHYAMDEMHADAVMEFDADFQHDPHDIPRMIKAMDDGADYVIGSRYIKGGEVSKEWAWHRKILSYFGGSILGRLMLGIWNIHDITAGYKLTKTSFLKRVDLDHLYSKNFAYKMHILHDVVKLGAKVKEVPVVFYERQTGVSKIIQKEQFESLYVLARLRWDDSQRFFKFLVVGGTGFAVQIVLQELSYFSGLASLLAILLQPIFHAANHIALANGVAAGIGAEAAIISNFILNNYWTFKDRKHQGVGKTLVNGLKFNLTSFASVIIQFLAIWVGVLAFGPAISLLGHALPTRDLILFPTIILIVIPMNYVIYNKLIWKKK